MGPPLSLTRPVNGMVPGTWAAAVTAVPQRTAAPIKSFNQDRFIGALPPLRA